MVYHTVRQDFTTLQSYHCTQINIHCTACLENSVIQTSHYKVVVQECTLACVLLATVECCQIMLHCVAEKVKQTFFFFWTTHCSGALCVGQSSPAEMKVEAAFFHAVLLYV